MFNNNNPKEQIILHFSKSWLGMFMFIFITMFFLILIFKNKNKLMGLILKKKKIILFNLGLAILLWRFINDAYLIDKNELNNEFVDYLIMNKIIFYIIAIWLISSKINKFVLITPIGLFSILSNTLNGIFNVYQLINSTLIISTIVLAIVFINPRWTIKKIIASFIMSTIFIIIPFSLQTATKQNIYILRKDVTNISIYSIQLAIFSMTVISTNRLFYKHYDFNKEKFMFIESIKIEIQNLFKNKKNIKKIIADEYKEYDTFEPQIEKLPLLKLNKKNVKIFNFIKVEKFPIIHDTFLPKFQKENLLMISPRAPNIYL